MIVSINKVKHFGLFKDFKWSGDIPGFRQYNLIYGWNFLGKQHFPEYLGVLN